MPMSAAADPPSRVGVNGPHLTTNLGVTQSIVNMGGFLATLFVLAVMGTVMTVMGGFTPEAFRVAWLVQYPVWLVAVIGVLVMRARPVAWRLLVAWFPVRPAATLAGSSATR
jgi:Na+-translocating ferredoxin:NAD+ oxidoreductase RnfE subunit